MSPGNRAQAVPRGESPAPAVRVRPAFETAILLACASSLLLPAAGAVAALVGLIGLWLSARPPRQERLFVGVTLILATLALAASIAVQFFEDPPPERWVAELERGFESLWAELMAVAEVGASRFEEPPPLVGVHLEEFQLLEAWVEATDFDMTLLLFAPDGELVAWAGEGLLHTLRADELPPSGFAHRQGYTASSVLAVAPLSDEPRSWRLVAGRSLAVDRLPFDTSIVPRNEVVRWAVGGIDAEPATGALRLTTETGPTVFVDQPLGLERRPRGLQTLLYQLGVGLVGLILVTLVLVRTAGARLLPQDPLRRPPPGLPLLAVAGTAALGKAAGFQDPLIVALAVSVGLATWGLIRPRKAAIAVGWGALRGALTLILLAIGAFAYQRWTGPEDVTSAFNGDADTFALCLVWCLSALGLLGLVSPRCAAGSDDRHAWWATLLLLASATACDFPLLALPLLGLSGAAIVNWIAGVDFNQRPAALSGLLVLAALAGSSSWEVAYREVFRLHIEQGFLHRISPPTADELNDLHQEVFDYFEQGRFEKLISQLADGPVDPQDLAFILWQDSPLSQLDALSALVIETPDGGRASFSFGLPIDDNLEFSLPPDRWSILPVPEWERALIQGSVDLELGQERLGFASYWLVPRPGFRLGVNEVDELEEALLRGGGRRKAIDGLPRGVHYGLYDPEGRAISSPWPESPPIDLELWEQDEQVNTLDTPDGRAWVWRHDGADGIALLYLPQLTALAGLERVGIHALASLAWIILIALLGLALGLPWTAFGELFQRTVRSYSKRMILVYAVLLLLPLIALNLVLLQSFSDRQRSEQRTHAQSALSSARVFLLDYLRGLERGFDLRTQVNEGLMEWISSVVKHPVNLYWGSKVYASSQQELFTSGLLPPRIPGEVYSRLALNGYQMGFRQHRGEVGYLELYAPLELGTGGRASQRLFLSVPLLEQEEEVARELEALRRRATLVTSALVLLLFAVGSRLARSFTKPIMELIGGTRRIAAGAQFLDVVPHEHELESLADAIDDMARRLAEGRRKLVLEKQVVERIVANITSGVVSLDHQRRVLLQNSVAAELLGTEIGAELEQALVADERLKPVIEFLTAAGSDPDQATLGLRDEDGEAREWTLTWVPIPGAENPATLLVVDDATEVLRGQRLEAWAEMARIIAHEIKNPLTPIRLSADHMRQVYRADRERFDEVFERCTANILKQVEELSDIASDFSIYSRIPRAVMVPGDLLATLQELVDGYRDAARSGVAIRLVREVDQLETRFDAKLLGRAVRNVLENALRASEGRGEVELTLAATDDAAKIRVVDSGPGVQPDLLRRIFEPYFSTYDSGTGLGLAITRRIIEEHNGSIEARNRASGGLEVAITIPLDHSSSA
ncbi:MAG: ATP-binding protein [Acidobacteriota bacterium]